MVEKELAGEGDELDALVEGSEILEVPGFVGVDDGACWRFEGSRRRGVDEVGEFGDDE